MYSEHVIATVQRAKVIGVCSAVNTFVKLVGTLYSCKFQRTFRFRGGCYGMTQVLFNITLLNFISNISTSANIREGVIAVKAIARASTTYLYEYDLWLVHE